MNLDIYAAGYSFRLNCVAIGSISYKNSLSYEKRFLDGLCNHFILSTDY